MVQKYFKRFELKYQISLPERDRIMRYVKGFMQADPNANQQGNYEVQSVYFDSPSRKAYYNKVNGVKFRKKLRIRYYPTESPTVNPFAFIEIKRKNYENVSKARILVPLRDVYSVIDGNSETAMDFYQNSIQYDRNTLEEIWYLKKRFNSKPVCGISYQRIALAGVLETKFRITFDTQIQATRSNLDFFQFANGDLKYIIPPTHCVMEVKFNNIIPKWAVKIVQANNCIQEKISKFASGVSQTAVSSLFSIP